ncbi:hypothetical protein [Ferruginibacter sp.]
MDILTKKQESFCENVGLFGVLISGACLIQQLILMNEHWINFIVFGVYILCITGFVLLMKKSTTASILLLIGGILVFLLEAYMILSLTYSLVLLVLLVYMVIVVTLLYMDGIEKQLKRNDAAKKAEAAKWDRVV